MLLVSYEVVFVENEAVFLGQNVQGHLQLQSSVQLFDIAFAITKFSFCGALFKCILAWERSNQKVVLRMKLFLFL